MRTLLLAAFLIGCGGEPDSISSPVPNIASAASSATAQHWTATGNDYPDRCSPAFPDIPASSASCDSVPLVRTDVAGECSIGCFGSPGDIRVAVGCRGCSAEYVVSFR